MKKLLVSILAFIYLFSSVGATIHMHYCMNKLVSWGFTERDTDKNACEYCGMYRPPTYRHCFKETRGCCSDEQQQIVITADQQNNNSLCHIPAPTEAEIPAYPDHINSDHYRLPKNYAVTHALSPAKPVPLFIRNCVFRI